MLKTTYKNEMFKLLKKKKLSVGAALTLAAVLLAALISSLVDNFAGVRIAGSASLPSLVLGVLSYTLMPLFIVLVATDMFGGEMRDNTIKMSFLRPVARWKIFTAKLLAVATFIALFLGLTLILSVLAAALTGAGKMASGKILLSYILTFFPLLVFATFAALMSLVIKSSGGAFALSVLLYLVMLALGILVRGAGSLLFTSAFGWHRLFSGVYINVGKILRTLLMLGGWEAILAGLGLHIFEKRDI